MVAYFKVCLISTLLNTRQLPDQKILDLKSKGAVMHIHLITNHCQQFTERDNQYGVIYISLE